MKKKSIYSEFLFNRKINKYSAYYDFSMQKGLIEKDRQVSNILIF
jgi:hypothetical protein